MMFKAQLICLAYMASFGTEYTNYQAACEYAQSIVEVGQTYDVDPEILTALIKKESNFNPKVGPNKAGACGLGQQIPRFTSRYSDRSYTCNEIKADGDLSIVLAAQAIRWIESNYTRKKGVKIYSDRNLKWTLCIYSAGPSNCPESSWRATKHGTAYARKVLKDAKKLEALEEVIESYLLSP